jgi:exoribonuclease R
LKLRFALDVNNFPDSFGLEKRSDANYLIEEYMLIANQLAAKYMLIKDQTSAILRRHEFPTVKSQQDFAN